MTDDLRDKLAGWGTSYEADMQALASAAGVAPSVLHERIGQRIASTAQTSDCLSLAELDELLMDRLAQPRRDHLAGCHFCHGVVALMAETSSASRAAFASHAVESASTGASNAVMFVSGLVAGVGIGAAATTVLTRMKSAADDEEPIQQE